MGINSGVRHYMKGGQWHTKRVRIPVNQYREQQIRRLGAKAIAREPVITREFRVIMWNPAHECEVIGLWNKVYPRSTITARFNKRGFLRDIESSKTKGFEIRRIERCWRVSAPNFDHRWADLEYARADREGLLAAHARWMLLGGKHPLIMVGAKL